MKSPQEIKQKIINEIKLNGPGFPTPIASKIKIQSLFVSAFLSELLSDNQIKITNMKVGGSPIYYLPGQEPMLEKFSEHLKSKEKEAFQLLKEKKFLEDQSQEPAIRIALRQIKDFAKAFKLNEKIIWRYFLTPTSEYISQKTPKPIQEKEKIPQSMIQSIKDTIEKTQNTKKEPDKKTEEIKKPTKEIKKIDSSTQNPPAQNTPIQTQTKQTQTNMPKIQIQNPLAIKIEEKKKKEKPKSEFVNKVIKFIHSKNWKIIQQIDYKAKEYNALVQISSDLGPITFKTQAKDKKTISEQDLLKLLQQAQSIPLPALIISSGTIQKKAIPTLETYNSILKFAKLE